MLAAIITMTRIIIIATLTLTITNAPHHPRLHPHLHIRECSHTLSAQQAREREGKIRFESLQKEMQMLETTLNQVVHGQDIRVMPRVAREP